MGAVHLRSLPPPPTPHGSLAASEPRPGLCSTRIPEERQSPCLIWGLRIESSFSDILLKPRMDS